ncbi:glycoside hydrolase family 108 protein [Amorphus orientalis]|uniref:Lysozyme family protein n=1 Tax=Amorphus orientalis TaxID=649198 RepID=A0AAE3VT54_9HYPH|nr:glycoside hydrolase family 108 protein [Amorphus orientalis]MDQ0317737.1 lysozyme family protein [Amorphus orientalis]
MTQSNFSNALAKVLVHEGGKADHPNDPGGRTNQGITQRTYDAYRSRLGLGKRDVWNITNGERDAIYRRQYWNVIHGDELPPGVAYVVFDGAVNSGPSRSVKWLQRALGSAYTGRVDGLIGIMTMDALRAVNDHDLLIVKILQLRRAFLKALSTWKYFGRGWTARVNDVRATGQAWARGSVGPAIHWHEGGSAKAEIEDAKKAPPTGVADALIGGGLGAGGGAQAIAEAKTTLVPLAGDGGLVDSILVGLTIAGIAFTLGGIAYRIWAKRKQAALEESLDVATA